MGNAPIAISRPEAMARPNRARSANVGRAGGAGKISEVGSVERDDCGGHAPVGLTEGSSTRQHRTDKLAAYVRDGLDQGLHRSGPATAPARNQHIAIDSSRDCQEFRGFRCCWRIQNDHLMQLGGMPKKLAKSRSHEKVGCIGGLAATRNQTERAHGLE